MDIFENLENLNVSEECFNDIVCMIEHCLNEGRQEGESIEDFKGRLEKKYLPVFRGKRKQADKIAKKLNKEEKELKKDYLKKVKKTENAQNHLKKGLEELDNAKKDYAKGEFGYSRPEEQLKNRVQSAEDSVKTRDRVAYQKYSEMQDAERDLINKQSEKFGKKVESAKLNARVRKIKGAK